MNGKQHFFKLTWYVKHMALLMSFFSFLSFAVFAQNSHYQLTEIAKLNHVHNEAPPWLQLVTHPNNDQQYFVINKVGQMYFVDDLGKQHLLLNLNTGTPKDPSLLKLTAIELHPNFALRGQQGYGTFYTAHLEILDKKNSTKRLQESSDELILKFDAVITEWQFHAANYQKLDASTQREVLRIAVPDNTMTIKQMSFSPYAKSWNDSFGLLYIALNGEEKWQQPLYSGVLLRIDPAKFGLRSFTVPSNNPYLKENNIKDEIYLLGGQNIKQFIWPDKNSDDILLSHHYQGKAVLSFAGGKADWRDRAPNNIIYQGDDSIEDLSLYRGGHLPSLRNKLLLLKQKNQRWFIESLAIKPSVNHSVSAENQPQPEWALAKQQVDGHSEVTLSHNRDGEVLILDKTTGVIFQMRQEKSTMSVPAEQKVTIGENQAETTNSMFIIVIVILAIGMFFYFFKRNKVSAKTIVRKQFAHIELSESQQQIGLYHRHKKHIDTLIDITDIVICEVKLNDNVIRVINQEVGHGFDNEKEQDLRNIFKQEKVEKMIDGKIRQISLSFTDIHNKRYTVCLYMRKGNNRVTKKTYSVVIDDVVDWCWLIASKINADETKKRKTKPVISSESAIDSVKKKYNQNTLNNHNAEVSAATQAPLAVQPNAAVAVTQEQAKPIETDNNIEDTKPANQSDAIDTGLVNALEKLVDLKQQGFLTQEEFTKAKENLLRSLFEQSND